MTVVNIKVQVPANGADVPAEGSLRWELPARRTGPDGALILVDSFLAPLVLGEATVDVTPGTWRVSEFFIGHPVKYKYLSVPADGPVNYTSLLEVDPGTLAPAFDVSPDPENPGFYLIGV
jgi:hypothetical protein